MPLMAGPAPRLGHRAFGLLVAGVFSVVTGLVWLRTGRVVQGTLVASAVFAGLAILFPEVLWPLNRAWSGILAPALGSVNNRLVLGLLFFGVVTPVALVSRLLRRDPLRLSRHRSQGTYLEPVGRQATSENLRDVF